MLACAAWLPFPLHAEAHDEHDKRVVSLQKGYTAGRKNLIFGVCASSNRESAVAAVLFAPYSALRHQEEGAAGRVHTRSHKTMSLECGC